MNSNFFQTMLTILLTISGIATTALLNMGCHDVSGSLNCIGATAPTWMLPYLGSFATILGILKLVIAAFTGKLTAPTVVVSNSGMPGTVSPRAVQ